MLFIAHPSKLTRKIKYKEDINFTKIIKCELSNNADYDFITREAVKFYRG